MARYQRARTTGGVTAIWTTDQASEIKRAFDWSKATRLFFFFCSLTTTSGWLWTAVVDEERGKGLKRERRVQTLERDEAKPKQGVTVTYVIRSPWFCLCVI